MVPCSKVMWHSAEIWSALAAAEIAYCLVFPLLLVLWSTFHLLPRHARKQLQTDLHEWHAQVCPQSHQCNLQRELQRALLKKSLFMCLNVRVRLHNGWNCLSWTGLNPVASSASHVDAEAPKPWTFLSCFFKPLSGNWIRAQTGTHKGCQGSRV